MTDEKNTAGVQELIDKLSEEGVAAGERQASKIVEDARQQAADIMETAHRQAAEIVRQGREEAQQYQAAGEEALRLAARDAVRDFSAHIHDGLRQRLQELAQHNLRQPDLIKQMILEITHSAMQGLEHESLELLLPEEIITEEVARKRLHAGEQDVLTDFVQGLIGEDLRQGHQVGSQSHSGLTVRIVDQNMEIDLTDESIGNLLAAHLLPRFRAIMR